MCEWSENYPDENTIAFDLNNGDLFVMKNDKKENVATISIDHDDAVRIFLCGDKTSRIKRIIAIAGGAPGMIVAFALCDRTASKTNMMLRVFTVCVHDRTCGVYDMETQTCGQIELGIPGCVCKIQMDIMVRVGDECYNICHVRN